jgi:uncharacterized protein (UPF0276 family)
LDANWVGSDWQVKGFYDFCLVKLWIWSWRSNDGSFVDDTHDKTVGIAAQDWDLVGMSVARLKACPSVLDPGGIKANTEIPASPE